MSCSLQLFLYYWFWSIRRIIIIERDADSPEIPDSSYVFLLIGILKVPWYKKIRESESGKYMANLTPNTRILDESITLWLQLTNLQVITTIRFSLLSSFQLSHYCHRFTSLIPRKAISYMRYHFLSFCSNKIFLSFRCYWRFYHLRITECVYTSIYTIYTWV